jgi:hypothetical protein
MLISPRLFIVKLDATSWQVKKKSMNVIDKCNNVRSAGGFENCVAKWKA